MVKTIIEAFPKGKKTAVKDGSSVIKVAECFSNTVQGEGASMGAPSTFLRLQNCTLNCTWCDTTEVWRKGNPYSVKELLDIWEFQNVLGDLETQHLILTGGSPLLQQKALLELLKTFIDRYNFLPYVEVENEAVLMPDDEFIEHVIQWNNSPKLSTSGMKRFRYKPDVIKKMSSINNSWFKFVITKANDWEEIKKDFLEPGLIDKEQIILMPEGSTREELRNHYPIVMDICCREGVRMSDRLQVTVFDKTTGV
jgi:7-carboxy-7-deazaguanine synthase